MSFYIDPETGWILPAEGTITSIFGEPFHLDGPGTYKGKRYAHFNKGVDIGGRGGESVLSMTPGVVKFVGDDGAGWGPRVIVVDDRGFEHSYGHMGNISVQQGTRISYGATIGQIASGRVGTSTGAHVSYDIFDPRSGEYVDPTPWLTQGKPHAYSALHAAIAAEGSNAPPWEAPAQTATINPNVRLDTTQIDDRRPGNQPTPLPGPAPTPRGGYPAPSPTQPTQSGPITGASSLPNVPQAASAPGTTMNPAQMAAQIRGVLEEYAARNGLSREWVQAQLAVTYQESGGWTQFVGDGGTSWGPWQINSKVHNISREDAMDPVKSTIFRLTQFGTGTQNLKDQWNALGGDRAFAANPGEFMRRYHSTVQGSVVPDLNQTNRALEGAYNALTGGTLPGTTQGANATGSPTNPYAPTGTPSVAGAGSRPAPGAFGSQTPGTPVDFSDTGVARSLLQQKIMEIVSSGSPSAMMELPALSAVLQTLNNNPNEMTAAQKADLAARFGINQANIEAERSNIVLHGQQEAAQQAQTIAFQTWQQTGDWNIANQQMQQTYDLGMRNLGISQQQVNIAAQRAGLDERQFQFDSGLATRQENRADRTLEQDDRQFQQSFGLQQQNQQFQERQADRTFALDTRRTISQERRDTVGAIEDLIGAQIRAGELTVAQANKAMDNLVELYKFHPTQGDYRPGYEPGGFYQMQIEKSGAKYDPAAYKMKPFPLDLATMAQAGGKFNLSTAWKDALGLLQQSGLLPESSAGLLNSGGLGGTMGAPSGTPLPSGGGQPGAGITPPTLPGAAPPQPTYPAQPQPTYGQAPAAPVAPSAPTAATAPGQVPPQLPQPEQPPVQQEQCGPGMQRVWDGKAWQCVPAGQAPQSPQAPMNPAMRGPLNTV